jgi:hypothetical protein
MNEKPVGRTVSYTSIPVRLVLLTFVLVFVLLSTTSMVQKSATFDEPNKLISGYANLKWRDYRLGPDHPPLARMITALPLLALNIPDPRNQNRLWEDSLVSDNARRLFTQAMLYRVDADWILFWGRIPVVGIAVILGFFVFFWARELYGSASAIVALFLYGFDPNILAHARLATSDLALTLFSFLSLYAFYQTCKRFTWSASLTCGLLIACAGLSKHNGWLVLITVLILGSAVTLSGKHWPVGIWKLRPLETKKRKVCLFISFILVTAMLIYLMIWASYGFRYRAVPALPVGAVTLAAPATGLGTSLLQAMKEIRFFPEAYLEGILIALIRIGRGHHYFLLGDLSTAGWWYYFLVAFLVKTPLPTLFLLGLGCAVAITKRVPLRKREYFLLAPVGVYFLASTLSNYNLGLRYILPIYPFLFVFISRLVPSYGEIQQKGKWAAGTLVALWYLISSQGIYPHYLAYFNEFTGGADSGYKVLVDSNLDWGQDLKGLKKWMLKNRVDLIGLSYFGTADPRYYEIPFVYLPSIPFYYPGHEERDVGRKPDFFAISATNLQGVFLNESDRKELAPFLKKEPITKVGHSIFIYR